MIGGESARLLSVCGRHCAFVPVHLWAVSTPDKAAAGECAKHEPILGRELKNRCSAGRRNFGAVRRSCKTHHGGHAGAQMESSRRGHGNISHDLKAPMTTISMGLSAASWTRTIRGSGDGLCPLSGESGGWADLSISFSHCAPGRRTDKDEYAAAPVSMRL